MAAQVLNGKHSNCPIGDEAEEEATLVTNRVAAVYRDQEHWIRANDGDEGQHQEDKAKRTCCFGAGVAIREPRVVLTALLSQKCSHALAGVCEAG